MDQPIWEHKLQDLADYPLEIFDASQSLLANSVIAADYDLLTRAKPGDKLLEIGCGSASWLRDNLPAESVWDGIDVYEVDARGRECIATRLGSVHRIPFRNNSFDWVLANQSIEHWSEYGVGIEQGLDEMGRVLKMGGQAHVNFPFYLHGHPIFVRGDLKVLIKKIDPRKWKVVDLIAYWDSRAENYPGWRRCGFPDFYVTGSKRITSSFVVNMVLEKVSSDADAVVENAEDIPLGDLPHIGAARMAIRHGPLVMAWKMYRKLRFGRSGY